MIPAGDGWFRLPDDAPRIPLLYAVLAAKPTKPTKPTKST
jgi:hypothetical protein